MKCGNPPSPHYARYLRALVARPLVLRPNAPPPSLLHGLTSTPGHPRHAHLLHAHMASPLVLRVVCHEAAHAVVRLLLCGWG
eukprot:354569-Chlamydomonas_euryale.AAC.8